MARREAERAEYNDMFQSFQKKYRIMLGKRVTAEVIRNIENILLKDVFYGQQFLNFAKSPYNAERFTDGYSFTKGAIRKINKIFKV